MDAIHPGPGDLARAWGGRGLYCLIAIGSNHQVTLILMALE